MDQFAKIFLNWEAMWHALPQLFSVGLPNTLILAASGFGAALVLGIILMSMLVSHHRLVRIPAQGYVDVWRGIPTILSIVLVGAGLPLAGLDVFGRNTYSYAILALAVINAAFVAEIFRSGVQSVERGQWEAARSLGLSYTSAMWLIIIPQGIRRVMPALVNQSILCLKESALIYLLGLTPGQRDLFAIGNDTAVATGDYSVLVAAAAVYLCIVIPVTHLVDRWDAALRRGRRIHESTELQGSDEDTGDVPNEPTGMKSLSSDPHITGADTI